jgi:hypothetical protein
MYDVARHGKELRVTDAKAPNVHQWCTKREEFTELKLFVAWLLIILT